MSDTYLSGCSGGHPCSDNSAECSNAGNGNFDCISASDDDPRFWNASDVRNVFGSKHVKKIATAIADKANGNTRFDVFVFIEHGFFRRIGCAAALFVSCVTLLLYGKATWLRVSDCRKVNNHGKP